MHPKLTGIIEHSSDNYSGIQRFFDTRLEYQSPINLGIRYQVSKDFTIGSYWMGKENFGVSAHFELNTSDMAFGSGIDPAPVPIRQRQLSDPNHYISSDIPKMSEIMKIDGFEVLEVVEFEKEVKNKGKKSKVQVTIPSRG